MQTIRGSGYRLVAAVSAVDEEGSRERRVVARRVAMVAGVAGLFGLAWSLAGGADPADRSDASPLSIVEPRPFTTLPGRETDPAVSPDGRHIGSILTGQRTSNVAWGDDGSTLYITADSYLMRVRLNAVGLGF